MTHTPTPEALQLAKDMLTHVDGCTAIVPHFLVRQSAHELRRLHARVQELEAEKARLIEAYVPCPSATEAYMYGITQEKQGC